MPARGRAQGSSDAGAVTYYVNLNKVLLNKSEHGNLGPVTESHDIIQIKFLLNIQEIGIVTESVTELLNIYYVDPFPGRDFEFPIPRFASRAVSCGMDVAQKGSEPEPKSIAGIP